MALVRERHPRIPLTLSVSEELKAWRYEDVSFLDFLEPHVWMTGSRGAFYKEVGYDMEASSFDWRQVDILAERAESTYRADEDRWRRTLRNAITNVAEWSRARALPLITTECWAIVNWKDRDDLPWEWVRELCEFGVRTAIEQERWIGIATSNFCGPQFTGIPAARSMPADVSSRARPASRLPAPTLHRSGRE
ncbi:cellulase-like family protein [Microbacterium sp. 10M-3C3]|uniref:cellulase-like family protein n=1 Tax=Microbacterium sp. 10M-3C3 TaxID=2483401 RepID=UPI0013DDE6E3|nr:cellulase-like family protein [Microbacterium sp. 10M-3C3]